MKVLTLILYHGKMVMDSFTQICISNLNNELASYHLMPIKFELVRVKYEAYEYAKIFKKDLLIELYVYADEAECKLNENNWRIFEKWGFSDQSDLIKEFIVYVVRILTTGAGINEEHRDLHCSLINPKNS